tara:strand:- start:840 stop:2072 length:1233 start_codon:yes stop_codon:yes gene_type:complete
MFKIFNKIIENFFFTFKKSNKNIEVKTINIFSKFPENDILQFETCERVKIGDFIRDSRFIEGQEEGNFLILCLGKAGSTWLASALNLHPDITCSSGIDHPVNSMSYPYNQELINKYLRSIRTIKDIQYGAISYGENYQKKAKKEDVNNARYAAGTIIKEQFKNLNINIDIPKRYRIEDLYSIILKELKNIPCFKAKFYGNVHGMDCRRFVKEIKKNKKNIYKNLKVMDLIAHPVKRMESIKNAAKLDYNMDFLDYKNMLDNFIFNNNSMIREIEKQFQIDFSDINNKIIFHNYYFFNYPYVHAHDIKYLDVPKIRFESIKDNPNEFKKVFNYLTNDSLVYSDEFKENVFSDSMKSFGRHVSKKEHTKSPIEIYNTWSEWEKMLFYNIVKQFNLVSFYKQYDYDLSFITKY